MKASLTLWGFDAYLQILQEANEDIDEIVMEGLNAGADVLIAGMQRRAPHPARIRQLIRKSKMGKEFSHFWIYVGVLRDTSDDEARIANTWEFGGPGLGTPKHPGRKHRRIQAHPYIRPALRQDARKARQAMEENFQEYLKK